MDLRLTEDQRMIRQTFRDFAQKEVKPLAKVLDARVDPRECIDWDLIKKASDLGIRTLAIPEEMGGLGADLITRLIVQEELGAADLGFADMMRGHGEVLLTLDERQRAQYLPLYLDDYRYFISMAHTEPDHGTDHLLICDDPAASTQTYAEKRGDMYVINGTKCFISFAGVAKLYIVHVRTDRKLPIKQCEADIIVPADTPGLSIGKYMDKLGRRLLINAEVILEDVCVPIENRVDPAKAMVDIAGHTGFFVCANTIGACRSAYEESLDYARRRVQGGKPIIQHQHIAIKLAEMKIKIEASRALIWQIAWRKENKCDYDPQMWKLAKSFVNKMSAEIVASAVDIFGGMGVDRELGIEKYLRDIYSTLHGLGLPDVSLLRGAPTLTTD